MEISEEIRRRKWRDPHQGSINCTGSMTRMGRIPLMSKAHPPVQLTMIVYQCKLEMSGYIQSRRNRMTAMIAYSVLLKGK